MVLTVSCLNFVVKLVLKRRGLRRPPWPPYHWHWWESLMRFLLKWFFPNMAGLQYTEIIVNPARGRVGPPNANSPIATNFGECLFAERHFAKCLIAECHFAECQMSDNQFDFSFISIKYTVTLLTAQRSVGRWSFHKAELLSCMAHVLFRWASDAARRTSKRWFWKAGRWASKAYGWRWYSVTLNTRSMSMLRKVQQR